MRNAGLEEAQAEIKIAGKISIISNMQMTPLLWQKVKRYDGVLAKVRKNGLSGVIGTFNGTVKIPVAYSYINTYFTLKGGMYLLVGDGNRMGAYHVDDEVEEVVPVTDGYTLDKVKSLIAEKEKE